MVLETSNDKHTRTNMLMNRITVDQTCVELDMKP